ncbi:MAG: hypothetical protein J6C44_03700 [Muribaculaceae bacterium]|nr:hypothetical protein [Muribaculaceae bacterium]
MKFYIIYILVGLSMMLTLGSCAESVQSNKAERNAIKQGNNNYQNNKFIDAIDDYNKAIEANPNSEAAIYNRALATLMSGTDDTTLLKRARLTLDSLGKNASDQAIAEKSIYNLANDAVYIGDALMAAADSLTGGAASGKNPMSQYGRVQVPMADSLKQAAVSNYRQAIHNYKTILRNHPNHLRALQNLRITQLKLPPEDQGGGNNDKDQQQQQQQQHQYLFTYHQLCYQR